jgi:predicted nucleic acid-binding Zn ribbon protein
MERATKLLRQYRFANRCVTPDQLVQAVWTRAVGEKVAAHSSIRGLWDGKLVVHVDDRIWQENLTTLSGQILGNLARLLGDGMVRDIEFRAGVPKRAPAREERVVRGDDDGIEDPILSRIYRVSKKRATS